MIKKIKNIFQFKKKQSPDEFIFLKGFQHNLIQMLSCDKRIPFAKLNYKATFNDRTCSLVLGPYGAGKEALFQQTEIKSLRRFASVDESGEMFITPKAYYLTIPGKFIENEQALNWNKLLKILRRYRGEKPFDNIVVTLNLHEILQDSKVHYSETLKNMRKIIERLTKRLNYEVPIIIIYSHIDLLAGFSEFFKDISEEDRKYVWGFDVSPEVTKGRLLKHCEQKYNQLLQRLQDQLIWRLQQERELSARKSITNFPLQIESLRDVISHTLESLFVADKPPANASVAGVFFASSRQKGVPVDYLAKPIKQTFNIEHQSHKEQTRKEKSFFVSELIRRIIPDAYRNNTSKTRWFRFQFQHMAVAAIFVIGLGACFFLANEFKRDMYKLQEIAQPISQYQFVEQLQKREGNKLFQLLQQLDALNFVEKTFEGSNPALQVLQNPYYQTTKISNEASLTYRQLLQRQLLPVILINIEKTLQNDNKDPGKIYGALKVYLMLGNPNEMQVEQIIVYLNQLWRNQYDLNQSQVKRLDHHLRSLFDEAYVPAMLDNYLIKKSQQVLRELPPSFLAYLSLKSQASEAHVNPLNDQQLLVSNEKVHAIPYIYTADGFKNIYSKKIIDVCRNVVQGNGVLGDDNVSKVTPSPALLEQQVRILYLTDYVNWWHLLLFNTQAAAFTDFTQALDALALFSSKDSPIVTFINTVRNNTMLDGEVNSLSIAFNNKVARSFREINRLSQPMVGVTLGHLKAVHDYLDKIQMALDSDEQAFEMTKMRFAQEEADDPISNLLEYAKTVPMPLDRWLHAIAINSWYLVLHKAQNHINSEWQKQVIPVYQKTIKERFPISAKASDEMSIDDFKQFFGMAGTLNNYFVNYVKPFLDMHNANWQAKSKDDLSIKLSKDMVEQFERASLIRKMFFDENDNFTLNFSLKASSFEPVVRQISLAINGQKITDLQRTHKPHAFEWPGSFVNSTIELVMQDVLGRKSIVRESGDWALFRFLEKVQLQANPKNTRQFMMTFTLNGASAKYMLQASSPINPFVHGIIQQFALPEKAVI